jgi:hypothetical protein
MTKSNQSVQPTSPLKTTPLYSKVLFCWLALLTGVIGGHWIYAGNKRFIAHLLLIPLSAFMGWIDCMRFGLMKDEVFNARFNPSYPADTPQTNGLVVTSVALSLGAFTTAFMTLLALLFQWYFAGQIS